eukprot:scaffold39743_cov75-Phaeocystis_antarctica.AAC.2
MRSDGAAAAVSAARPRQTRCSSAAPAPHPAVPIRTTDAPSSVVSHSGGGTSSGGGNGDGGGTSVPQHLSSHSNPTATQRSVIRVSSASICSQLPTKSTSPSRSAVGASSESPVQNARSHAAAESRRRAATLTTPGSTPRRTSGKPKVASACASTSLGVERAGTRHEFKAQPRANGTSEKLRHCQAGLFQRAARACRGTGRASRRRASRRDTRPRWAAPCARAGRADRRRRAGRRGRHSAGWRRRRGCHPSRSARGRRRGRPARRRRARWVAARRHRRSGGAPSPRARRQGCHVREPAWRPPPPAQMAVAARVVAVRAMTHRRQGTPHGPPPPHPANLSRLVRGSRLAHDLARRAEGRTPARRAAARSQARAAALPRHHRYTPGSKAFPSGEGQG